MINIINTFKDIFCKFKLDDITWAFIGKLYFLILIFTLILLNLGIINISAEEKTITDDKTRPGTSSLITEKQKQAIIDLYNGGSLTQRNTIVYLSTDNGLIFCENTTITSFEPNLYNLLARNYNRINEDGTITFVNQSLPQYLIDFRPDTYPADRPPGYIYSLYTTYEIVKPIINVTCKHNLYGDCQIIANGKLITSNKVFIGDNVELNAIPKTTGKFINWSNGITTQSLIYNNIDKDIDITANFEKVGSTGPIDPTPPSTEQINITFKSNISNSFIVEFPNQPHLNGNTTISIDKGSQLAFIIKPVDGYNITRISDGYVTYTPNQEYSYSFDYNTTFNITSERVSTPVPPPVVEKVNITFTSDFYNSFNVEYPDNTSLNGNKTIQVDKGSQLKFIIKPVTGYHIKYITDGVSQFSANVVNSIVCNSNTTITIHSEKNVPTEPPNPPQEDIGNKPSLNLPKPNIEEHFEINVQNNNLVNQHISTGSGPTGINIFESDIYELYVCYKEDLNMNIVQDKLDPNKYVIVDDNFIQYYSSYLNGPNLNVGDIIIPIYHHTEVEVFAPNFSVSSKANALEYSGYSDYNIKYIVPSNDGLIQKDISKFKFQYTDKTQKNLYSLDKLPLTDSQYNKNKIEYVGQTFTTSLKSFASFCGRYIAVLEDGLMLSYYFDVTDSQETVNSLNLQVQNNILHNQNMQALEQSTNFINKTINAFKNMLDNLIQHGNNKTQQAQQQNQQVQNQLDNAINKHESLENQHIQNMNDSLNKIDVNKNDISKNPSFIESAKFVKLNFDKLTQDNPIGQLLTFSLIVGLALLVIAKKL